MKRHHLIALGLIVLVAAVFSEVPHMDFLDWDDPGNVFDNRCYRPVTVEKLAQLWREPMLGFYMPVTRTVWAGLATIAVEPGADLATAPQPFRPGVFHAANLVVHAANVLLVFALLRLLGLGDWGAGAGAAVFAVHPLQVEPVAWVTGLKDVLSACFALLALWQYLLAAAPREQGRPGRPRLRYALGLAFFALGVLSKQTVVVLPAIAFALDVGVLRRPWRRSALALAGWLPVALAGALLASWTEAGMVPTDEVAWWQRPFVAGDALAFYLGKLFCPVRLMAHYGRAPLLVMQHCWAYLTWLAPAGLIVVLVGVRGRAPELTAAGAVFIIGLLPVLGLVPFGNQDVGNRFAYLSMLGAAQALGLVVRALPHRATAYVIAALVLVLSALSLRESYYWYSSATLFERNAQLNPRSWAAHEVLGKEYQRRGDPVRAEAHYRLALQANPSSVGVYDNYGALLSATGRPEQAVEMFRRAIELDPERALSRFNLGTALLALDRAQEAVDHLRQGARLSPGDARMQATLGSALVRTGAAEEGIAHLRRAIELDPGYGLAHFNLGLALRDAGRQQEATEHFDAARRLGITLAPPPPLDRPRGQDQG
ncbi:MAG: tetratricopeptide repeat protein [Armatimonadota bacterium]